LLGNYRIVAIVPVGRRQYIDALVPYILRDSNIIDECILWINTNETYDIGYAYSLSCRYPNLFKVENFNGVKRLFNKNSLLDIYFKNNKDETIYIKINDDICWVDSEAIRNLVLFRIQNPEFFAIYPLLINSSKTTLLGQLSGFFPIDITGKSPIILKRQGFDLGGLEPQVSEKIHSVFLEKLKNNDISELVDFVDKYIIYDYEYIPEHCICWFGRDFKTISNKTYKQNLLTEIEPKSKNKNMCICGTSLMSHFSFIRHEKYLSNTDLFEQYKNLIQE
jgi:hypothetical protein